MPGQVPLSVMGVSESKGLLIFFFFETGSHSAAQATVQSTISAYCSLNLPDSSNPPTLASEVAQTTGMRHQARLYFGMFLETGSGWVCYLGFGNSWTQVTLLPWPPKVLGCRCEPPRLICPSVLCLSSCMCWSLGTQLSVHVSA